MLSLPLSTICSSTTFCFSRPGSVRRGRRRWPTRQRDQLRFRRAVEYPWPDRFGIVLEAQDHLETFLDKLPPRSFHGVDARIQRLGDPAIAPPVVGFRNIGFQRDAAFVSNWAGCLPLPMNSSSRPVPPYSVSPHTS